MTEREERFYLLLPNGKRIGRFSLSSELEPLAPQFGYAFSLADARQLALAWPEATLEPVHS